MQQQLQKQARNIFGAFPFPNFTNPYTGFSGEAAPKPEAEADKGPETERKS
jgi:hypothetical protein